MRLLTALLLFFTPLSHATESDVISHFLDGFHQAAAESDFDGYFSHFSADATFLGTDASERWGVEQFKQYAKPAFDKGDGWSYVNLERNIVIGQGGKIAWFDEIMFSTGLGKCRGTGVLIHHDGRWQLATYSLTMLIPNDIAYDVARQAIEADKIPESSG
jgi:ketosteroid isomerase-like protein